MKDQPVISSVENAKIKRARAIREGRESDMIFVEGVRLTEELLRSPVRCTEAFVCGSHLDDSRIVSLINEFNAAGIDITLISQKVADSLSDTKTGQGIVVLAERPRRAGLADLNLSSNVPVVVFLEKVNTPSNLGAVIRTSEAAGINGLIVSQGAADPYSPKSLRASMGSAFRLPIVTGVTMAEALEWARDSGMIATAADISATVGHTNVDWRRPRLLVFGSEAHGLDQDDLDRMNELTLIEMNDKVESLNLAVSCGIILFEARRQNLK